MSVKKNHKAILLTLMLFSIVSYAKSGQQNYLDDKGFQAWRVGDATSYEFPATMVQVYGMNKAEGWGIRVDLPHQRRYNHLCNHVTKRAHLDLKDYQQCTYPEYDGYSLPLDNQVTFIATQVGRQEEKTLLDELQLYWWVGSKQQNRLYNGH